MDLYCPRCGEPWDNDTFHEAAEEQETTYRDVMRRFQTEGCVAIGWGSCSSSSDAGDVMRNRDGIAVTDAAAMLYELLGDDTDGAAAMFEDMGY